MNELRTYIKKVTGVDIEELDYPVGALQRLPLFIREGNSFFFAKLYNHHIVFVEPKSEDNVTPGQIQKHISKIETAFGCPVVWLFSEMTWYLKEQLINSRISFIVPGKQLFIPFMFMELNDQQKIRITKTESFSPSAQCILIYHLWMESLVGLNFKEIAEIFKYTPRTIGRCAEELKNAGACSIVGRRSKYLKFDKTKREIWETVQDYFETPVKRIEWLLFTENIEVFRIAGLEALSCYSNISSGDIKSFAIDANVYKELQNNGEIHPANYNEHDVRLEIWSYDPTVLTRDEFVDPFSLYLSFVYDKDERIQIELEKMINRIL